MPLQQLTEYFNIRFEQEHHSSFRPFVLKEDKVSGIFGPVCVSSVFSPVRRTTQPTIIAGHTAHIDVSTTITQPLYESEIENLLADDHAEKNPATQLDSFVHFDRLARTVHMLNYLRFLPINGTLFLEVDPRHILGIKQDHGVYFGEIIAQCGLKNSDVAIVLSLYSQYSKYYHQLLNGLNNYRRQNYRIALKFGHQHVDGSFLKLIGELKPDFVSISAKNFDLSESQDLSNALQRLGDTVRTFNGKSIMQDIQQKNFHDLARAAGFDFVEGTHYKAIAFDYLRLENAADFPVAEKLRQKR